MPSYVHSSSFIRALTWEVERGQFYDPVRSLCKEQRSVIRFLTAEGEKPAAIHWWIVPGYGEKCVSDKSARKWSARFCAGRENVDNDQTPSQSSTVITSDLIDKMADLVRSDRRVTL
ncbi:HTH_48 domain-containing protein [Trichonephila clavipes]|nr:HTH_48 domain-containing protein [Trichonephila clavipes]